MKWDANGDSSGHPLLPPLAFSASRACLLAFLLVSIPPGAHAARAVQDCSVQVRVDPRMELLGVIYRLADFAEFSSPDMGGYTAAVDAHFRPFREHPAVKAARSQRSVLGYDAIPNLALRLVGLSGLAKPISIKDDQSEDRRWAKVDLEGFLASVTDFARASAFGAFVASQRPLYESLETSPRAALCAKLDAAWFARTLGARESDSIAVVISPLLGGDGYGVVSSNEAGGIERTAVIGAEAVRAGAAARVPLALVVHEVLHGFVNPWLLGHFERLRAATGRLVEPVRAEMSAQAYGQDHTVLAESLVRALSILYLETHGAEAEATLERQECQARGFFWIQPMLTLLRRWTGDGSGVASLQDLAGRLATALDEWSASASASAAAWRAGLFADSPKVISRDPPQGATGVDPALRRIRIGFDRPMASAVAIAPAGGAMPDCDGVEWSEGNRVLTLSVHLEPGRTIRFTLNRAGFYPMADGHGRPLEPAVISFTTR